MPAHSIARHPSRSRQPASRSVDLRRLGRLLRKLLREEPVAVTAVVQAIIGVGIAFGWWHWTPAQTGAVVGLAAGSFTVVRGMVIPTAKQRQAAVAVPGGAPVPGTVPR